MHVLVRGRIVRAGGPELARELEAAGLRPQFGEGRQRRATEKGESHGIGSADAELEGPRISTSSGSTTRRTTSFKSTRGLDERDRARDLRHEGRAGVDDASSALRALKRFERSRMPTWGADLSEHRLRRTSTTTSSRRRARADLGRRAGGHQEHLRPARHPRGGAQVPGRRRRAVRVRGRLPQPARGPREAGRHLPRHGRRLREHPDIVKEYFGTVIPPDDNKFAALNSAVWSGGSFVYVPAGRAGRDPAAGVLPHQRGERGPVRADADHRRGGLVRPLRRGLHRPTYTHATRCTAPSSRSSSSAARASATRPSRTGRRTSTTW